MNITINNYEEYFLLLADNELSLAEEVLVKQFAALHPHLQEELQLLLSCRLDAADMPLFPKETLLRPTIWDVENPQPVHTQMLDLMDDELPAMEKAQLKQQIAESPVLKAEWNTLQKAVLPAEAIAYPDKKQLYRQQKIRPLVWLRWAAAAAVIALAWALWPFEKSYSLSAGAIAALPKLNSPVSIPVQLMDTNSSTVNIVKQPDDNVVVAQVKPAQQAQKDSLQVQQINQQPLLASAGKQHEKRMKEKASLKKNIELSAPELLVMDNPINESEIATLGNRNSLTATLTQQENILGHTAQFTPKGNLLAAVQIQNTPAINTAAMEEDESYVHIAGARIDKHKMRGLFRGLTRSVARTFSKSKIQPEVVSLAPRNL